MAEPLSPIRPSTGRFGAGLDEAEVHRFQSILREQCGVDLGLPGAWSRAIELLSLVELLLESGGIFEPADEPSAAVRASSLLTDFRS